MTYQDNYVLTSSQILGACIRIFNMFDILFGWRKASKCKKLIRCVQYRLKLLKNKRSSIIRQLREDIAQLLKNGRDQSAFIRAEQLYKDQSILAIYDLLDHFCEFIIIHLPYIRRHRDCPNDINDIKNQFHLNNR